MKSAKTPPQVLDVPFGRAAKQTFFSNLLVEKIELLMPKTRCSDREASVIGTDSRMVIYKEVVSYGIE